MSAATCLMRKRTYFFTSPLDEAELCARQCEESTKKLSTLTGAADGAADSNTLADIRQMDDSVRAELERMVRIKVGL